MTMFQEIFGSNPPELGSDCRPDFDRRPRPDIAISRQRTTAWEQSESYRKAGDIHRAIQAALLVLAYDGLGRLRSLGHQDEYRLEPWPPAYGIHRSLRIRLRKAGLTIPDVLHIFADEASDLLKFLPPAYQWPSVKDLTSGLVAAMREVE